MTCFNGAAPARARNGVRLLIAAVVRLVLQRGRARAGAEWIACSRSAHRSLDVASTGPRPRGRGMLADAREDLRASRRFNGAAPARARNGFALCMSCRTCCFNGAAPARARNGQQSISALTAPSLQRGRARAGAECWPHDREDSAQARRFNGAAPARARNVSAVHDALEPVNVASTGPRPRGRGMCHCCPVSQLRQRLSFNGAAPARARNATDAGCGHSSQFDASTGPRPRGRGMMRSSRNRGHSL